MGAHYAAFISVGNAVQGSFGGTGGGVGGAAYAYSGWLFGYLHLSNALYSVDPDTARASFAALPVGAQTDMAQNNAYWKQ